mmetsp:Transcript_39201/g.122642  ORF Transcript_39201/g.122642 Transcript_39201/m.122642 type:complete len:344 (+) Transcript_39201:1663-2694(+)
MVFPTSLSSSRYASIFSSSESISSSSRASSGLAAAQPSSPPSSSSPSALMRSDMTCASDRRSAATSVLSTRPAVAAAAMAESTPRSATSSTKRASRGSSMPLRMRSSASASSTSAAAPHASRRQPQAPQFQPISSRCSFARESARASVSKMRSTEPPSMGASAATTPSASQSCTTASSAHWMMAARSASSSAAAAAASSRAEPLCHCRRYASFSSGNERPLTSSSSDATRRRSGPCSSTITRAPARLLPTAMARSRAYSRARAREALGASFTMVKLDALGRLRPAPGPRQSAASSAARQWCRRMPAAPRHTSGLTKVKVTPSAGHGAATHGHGHLYFVSVERR